MGISRSEPAHRGASLLAAGLWSAVFSLGACAPELAQGQGNKTLAALPKGVPPAKVAATANPSRAPGTENAAQLADPLAAAAQERAAAVPQGAPEASSPDTAPEDFVRVPIEDPSGHALDAFHVALRRAEVGEGQARIVFYGASHVASDLFTGDIRERLQARFGDAGPGFVLPAKPWRWYRHTGFSMERSRGWHDSRVKARAPVDGMYGLAGVALDADKRPAIGAIETRSHGASDGNVRRAELFYLRQPGGGRISVFIDGKRVERLRTAAEHPTPAYALYELEDGPHRLEVRTHADGPVRIFGMALERDAPGVILDTLGIPGARARYHLHWEDSLYREHLARRAPDLVVLAYGTNESGDDDVPIESYENRLRKVLARVREVTPNASCLLVGPSDRPVRADDDTYEPRPRTALIVEAQRRVAHDAGCGFFDLVAFMGGPMSMVRWVQMEDPLGTPDHVHYTLRGYRALGEVLHDALLEGYVPASQEDDGARHPLADSASGTDSQRSLQ